MGESARATAPSIECRSNSADTEWCATTGDAAIASAATFSSITDRTPRYAVVNRGLTSITTASDPSASSRHASIYADPATGQAYVEDDGSRRRYRKQFATRREAELYNTVVEDLYDKTSMMHMLERGRVRKEGGLADPRPAEPLYAELHELLARLREERQARETAARTASAS